MHGFFSVWDYVRWTTQLLLILGYGASVAALVLGLKRVSGQPGSYYCGLLFLTLCPFFLLFIAAAIRLAPIFYRVDSINNAQELLGYAVAPLYLGLGTTLLLVVIYSALYVRGRHS